MLILVQDNEIRLAGLGDCESTNGDCNTCILMHGRLEGCLTNTQLFDDGFKRGPFLQDGTGGERRHDKLIPHTPPLCVMPFRWHYLIVLHKAGFPTKQSGYTLLYMTYKSKVMYSSVCFPCVTYICSFP